VPKIIPYQKLGTAYSVIFWVQNIGLACVPLLIGTVLDKYGIVGKTMIDGIESNLYDYTVPMVIFACFGALSVVLALLLRREDRRKGYGLELPNVKK
jgi:hypothetical protein